MSGSQYLSDDMVVSDGQTVRGIPRAIQFDPESSHTRLPPWLAQATLDNATYPVGDSGEDNSALMHIPGRDRTLDSVRAADVSVCVLQRGDEDALAPLAAAPALAELLGAAHNKSHVDLGAFLAQPAFRLTWSDPRSALSLLERA
jgi:hypothetical protein